VTGSRADYGIYLPLLRRLDDEATVTLRLLVTGMHLSPRFGMTVKAIEADGFPISERIDVLSDCDRPEDIAAAMGRATLGFGEAFARSQPDILVVLGDRFEMHGAAVAALPFKIPVAHIHGGELTEGAIDDSLRHCLTKLSHLHFVSTAEYARRVMQLGEEPWRVTISGAPGLDNVHRLPRLSAAELQRRFGITVTADTVLVTFHPTTLEFEAAGRQADELFAALRAAGLPILVTMPNADTGGLAIRARVEAFIREWPAAQAVETLGAEAYLSVLALCSAIVGNSSSALIEAPCFELPAVNVGTRQNGRIRGKNVIDVGYGRDEILIGIQRARDDRFRESLRGMPNPYGDGRAAERIAAVLLATQCSERLVAKRFADAVVAEV
jgi:UDP-N-acetylglucosamine 2-epimerase (non-hydrolysing)/GDP/UDP-N,N'-diacetylbacillosamine 2-epimerase (hydrolysing)